jgi:hypothetical protein
VAQHGVGPARQNGSHEDTAPFELAMTDRIDTLVNAVKPSPGQPSLDRTGVETHSDQLPVGHNSVLPISQFGDLLVTCLRFPSHVLGKCRQVWNSPPGGAQPRR